MYNERRKNTWYDQSYSFKGKTPLYYERRKNTWYDQCYASIFKGQKITCFYCVLIGHMKVDCGKRLNDLKSQRFQSTKRSQNEKRLRKRNHF